VVGIDPHIGVVPDMEAGCKLTVTGCVTKQPPVGMVYLMTGTLPLVTPVTTPDDDPILAAVVLLVHMPPVVASVNVMVKPEQTLNAEPAMAVGLANSEMA
jgi:hypothetical protein